MLIDLHTRRPITRKGAIRAFAAPQRTTAFKLSAASAAKLYDGVEPKAYDFRLFEHGPIRGLLHRAAELLDDDEGFVERIFVKVGDEWHAIGWSKTARVITRKEIDAASDVVNKLEDARRKQEAEWDHFWRTPLKVNGRRPHRARR